jgi:L-lactate utilization protein LutC
VSAGRDAFLQRIRRAVQTGNRTGQAPPLPARGSVGYQGAGPHPAASFCEQFSAAGGKAHRVARHEAAASKVLELLQAKAARRVLLGRGTLLDSLALAQRLRLQGFDVARAEDQSVLDRESLFAADIGITGVDYLVAETGSLVLLSLPDTPRSLSLLPPIHIAVATADQIVPDLFDLVDPTSWGPNPMLPSCISLITGPSKTGDIELRLVTGVHGPGEVHVVLIEEGVAV